MGKDDYFVIVYQILAYLYAQMKNGEKINPDCLKNDGPMYNISYSYWSSIMVELKENGYIKGITFNKLGDTNVVLGLEQCEITMKGVEYLTENSKFKKVVNTLKEIKGIIPFEII